MLYVAMSKEVHVFFEVSTQATLETSACLCKPILQTQVGKQSADRGQQHQLVAQAPMMQPPQPQMQPPPPQILDLLTPEMKQQLWASYVQGCSGLFGQQAQGQPNIVYFQNKGAGQPNDPSAAQLQLQLPSGSNGLPNTIAANGQASTASAGQGSTVEPSTVNAQQQQQQTNQAKLVDSNANSNMVNAQLQSIEALSGTQDGNHEQKTLEDIEKEHMERLEKKNAEQETCKGWEDQAEPRQAGTEAEAQARVFEMPWLPQGLQSVPGCIVPWVEVESPRMAFLRKEAWTQGSLRSLLGSSRCV